LDYVNTPGHLRRNYQVSRNHNQRSNPDRHEHHSEKLVVNDRLLLHFHWHFPLTTDLPAGQHSLTVGLAADPV